MRATERLGDGVWFADTRILSEFRVLIGGVEPQQGGVQMEDGFVSFELSAGDLRVTRLRYMDGGLRERITITNPGPGTVEQEVELVFAADFAAMLAIRGIVPELPPPVPAPASDTPDGLLITRRDWPGQSSLVIVRPAGVKRRLRLGPGKELTIFVDVVPGAIGAGVSEFDEGLVRIKASYPRWLAESVSMRTDNPAVNELLERCLTDIRMLLNRYPTGVYPTGGLPWYAVPFGRDQLMIAMQMLPVNPEITRGILRYLAARQGRRNDPGSEEQPGKILHEVRTGEVVDRGLWPHHLFGTIDATPLFLCALAETADWIDESLLDELWTNAEAAIEWCAKHGDMDEDGYIEYRGARARNQGWKDSDDSLTHVDGTDPPRPVALCEVQAYLYRGLLGMSRKRPELKERAEELRRRFNRDFWMSGDSYVAQALDGSKRQVQAITSNPSHCLWAGILPPERAANVAERLVSPEMFNGWGIRTLSTRAINYDPDSYHNGSVWPFDTAMAAAGLRSSGFPDQAERVARALIEAGMAAPLRRMPELWRGDDRKAGTPPADYAGTCSPQAWSAAAAFSLVTTLLGLRADATQGRLTIAPVETPLWRRVEVNGLHFGGHRIDFVVEGTEVRVGRLPAGITVSTPS